MVRVRDNMLCFQSMPVAAIDNLISLGCRPSEETNKAIVMDQLYLLDSGAQYRSDLSCGGFGHLVLGTSH